MKVIEAFLYFCSALIIYILIAPFLAYKATRDLLKEEKNTK
jgi:hypothetical protein